MQLLQDAFRRTAGTHLTPVKGVWAAVGMLLSLLVLEVLGHNRVGSSAAVGTLLGVLFVAFCDIGPSLRIRAWAMGSGAVLGALLIGLGSWIGGPWWVAVPAIGLVTFISGVLPIYGKIVTQVGVVLTIIFAVTLGKGGGPGSALPSALGFLFGGMFFLALALVSSFLRRFFRAAADIEGPAAALGPPPAPSVPLPDRSLLLQLALLRALGAALIAGAAWASNISSPHWAPVVVIASIRTDQVAAVNLTIQRIAGTVLGAGLADVVLAFVEIPAVLAGLAVGGVFLAFTVKDVNNTYFIFFLTFLTLLLRNIAMPGPTYVVLRIVATLIGALAALVVSWLSVRLVRHASAASGSPPGAAA